MNARYLVSVKADQLSSRCYGSGSGGLEMIMLYIWMQVLFSGPLALMHGEPTVPAPKQHEDQHSFVFSSSTSA